GGDLRKPNSPGLVTSKGLTPISFSVCSVSCDSPQSSHSFRSSRKTLTLLVAAFNTALNPRSRAHNPVRVLSRRTRVIMYPSLMLVQEKSLRLGFHAYRALFQHAVFFGTR